MGAAASTCCGVGLHSKTLWLSATAFFIHLDEQQLSEFARCFVMRRIKPYESIVEKVCVRAAARSNDGCAARTPSPSFRPPRDPHSDPNHPIPDRETLSTTCT